MAIFVLILKEALKLNLHVAALLLIIIGIGIYALFKYKLSEQSTEHKFNFIGIKLTDIDKKVDGLSNQLNTHEIKIIALETVQSEWGKRFEEFNLNEKWKDAEENVKKKAY